MSRRAKLWLSALFLGLTAIPLVYLIMAWRPPDPLRFRLVRDQGHSSLHTHSHEVEIENTKGVSIVLHHAMIWSEPVSSIEQPGAGSATATSTTGGDSPPYAPFFGQLDISGTSTRPGWHSTPPGAHRGTSARFYRLYPMHCITIPPHGASRLPIHVLAGSVPDFHHGELRLSYTWMSRPRHLVSRLLEHSRRHLPQILHTRLPSVIAEDTSTRVEDIMQPRGTAPYSAQPAGERTVAGRP